MTRRFVVVGQKATASKEFSLVDIPGTSGRLDVLLRCLRAALCVSHGLRKDTLVYLVLLGGPEAPRVLRVDGRFVRFVRPDERMLAILVQKALSRLPAETEPDVFFEIRPGLAVARGGLEAVLADLGEPSATSYVLEEESRDLREGTFTDDNVVVFVGDNHGFDPATRARLAAFGAAPIGVGPVSLHADDAITIVCNEMDRRRARRETAEPSP